MKSNANVIALKFMHMKTSPGQSQNKWSVWKQNDARSSSFCLRPEEYQDTTGHNAAELSPWLSLCSRDTSGALCLSP